MKETTVLGSGPSSNGYKLKTESVIVPNRSILLPEILNTEEVTWVCGLDIKPKEIRFQFDNVIEEIKSSKVPHPKRVFLRHEGGYAAKESLEKKKAVIIESFPESSLAVLDPRETALIKYVHHPHQSKNRKFPSYLPTSAGICAIHVALEILKCEKVYVAGIEMSMDKAYHPSLILEKKEGFTDYYGAAEGHLDADVNYFKEAGKNRLKKIKPVENSGLYEFIKK